jgi:hypothetical protein
MDRLRMSGPGLARVDAYGRPLEVLGLSGPGAGGGAIPGMGSGPGGMLGGGLGPLEQIGGPGILGSSSLFGMSLGSPAMLGRLTGAPDLTSQPLTWPGREAKRAAAAAAKAGTTPGATTTPTASGTGDIWGVIDEEARDDPQLAQALKLAVQLESGGRADAVGDQGHSYGYYQINQPAHGQNITPEQSRDARQATRYRLPEFRAAKARVVQERPGLWESDPMAAASLTAFLAQRPAQPYRDSNVRAAWQTIQQRQAAPAAAPAGGNQTGTWDKIVPGGRGQTVRGGTHGGYPAVDIMANEGTPIYSPVDGVSAPGQYPLGGNATTITGSNGRSYYLAHGQRPFVGGQVKRGDVIGYVGRTGNAAGGPAHLHLAMATNPTVFNQRNGSGDLDPYVD